MHELPRAWSKRRVDEIAEFRRGLSWSKDQERSGPGEGRVPVLRIPNVQKKLELEDLLFVEVPDLRRVEKSLVSNGSTLLVGSNGNAKRVGNCVFLDRQERYAFASFLLAAVARDDAVIDPRFLFRVLSGDRVQQAVTEGVQGSTGLKNINLSDLRSLEVLVPPLAEQRKIAAILSSVDETIEKTEAVIAQLDVVKKAMLEELLTRGIPDRHSRFKQTEIGEVPEEWNLVALGDVAAVEWGDTAITKAAYIEDGYTAFSASGPDGKLGKWEHEGAGIVLSAIGARCGRCFWADGKWTAIKNTITIRSLGAQGADLRFLFHVLGRDGFWPSSGGAQPFIALGPARKSRLALPSPGEQAEVADALFAMDAKRRTEEAVLAALFCAKVALSGGLLSGSLRVAGEGRAS